MISMKMCIQCGRKQTAEDIEKTYYEDVNAECKRRINSTVYYFENHEWRDLGEDGMPIQEGIVTVEAEKREQ